MPPHAFPGGGEVESPGLWTAEVPDAPRYSPPRPQARSSAHAREMDHESSAFIPAPQHSPIFIYTADNCFGLFLGFIADCIFNVMGS